MDRGAAEERAHTPGDDAGWEEAWSFDFARDDGTGGFVRLALRPAERVAWYWAYLLGPDLGLVAVREHEVPLPRRADDLEVRADALWAELVCETPFEHWGLALEAFGLRLDEPTDEIGERLPVGLDLEWEVAAPAFRYPGRYAQAGVMHGELLVGRDRLRFSGQGLRDHAWGHEAPRPGRGRGWFCAGDALALELELGEGAAGSGAAGPDGWTWRPGETPTPVGDAMVESHPGPDDVPSVLRWVLDRSLEVELDVVAHAVVPLDPGRAHLVRALCTGTTSDGDTGVGWAEWARS